MSRRIDSHQFYQTPKPGKEISFLFDGSVMSNIALTRPDASFEEVVLAAQVACAHDFIQEMPGGYNSSVGERGAGMSGGQRQRMAIARMILRRPRLLVLDEATSALDNKTESDVIQSLDLIARRCTTVVIAHRLTTIKKCDRVYEFSKGKIIASGSFDDLRDKSVSFKNLIEHEL